MSPDGFLPIPISLPAKDFFSGGNPIEFQIVTGLHIFVGPNGSGKTDALKSLRDQLRAVAEFSPRKVIYLSAGRSSEMEPYRSATQNPGAINTNPAAVGHQNYRGNWWQFEGTTGMFLRLKERPDLLLKVEARLQGLYQKRLRLEWSQSGLQVGFSSTAGGKPYYANAEASGLIQLIPLLAAVYDDGIAALLIDEPEISMHPQLQAFLLQEMEIVAGDPKTSPKKIIVIATHSSTMMPIRKINDLLKLIFFTERKQAPIQIQSNAGELKSHKLGALIARLSENHKLAFFSNRVLLVEGPSDEIVVNGIALKLEHPLLGNNTQVVPVTGKGQFSEAIKLFRLMGKDVFVLADLDGLSDDNQLIAVFHERARLAANEHGLEGLSEIDRSVRNKLNSSLNDIFRSLTPTASVHRYWAGRGQSDDEEVSAKRRATLAALLSSPEESLSGDLLSLRKRYDVLLDILAKAGCIILRAGTIEDCYFEQQSPSSSGKPETAATEMERIAAISAADVRKQFSDVVRAMEIAAPIKKIDENALLREQLGSLLGAALQIVNPGMTDEELNARATANFSSPTPVFHFANRSTSGASGSRRVAVSITSPLFIREGFPFEIGEHDNPTAIVDQKLPSS